ncbi:MAG: alpha/beta fold hydrolase [Ignavibacteriales bacterium]|nr:alpha/beta fold hydrolase [Ignavibacteriales bacterium]
MTLFLALLTALVVFLFSATLILTIVGPSFLLRPRRRTAEFYKRLGQPTHPSELGLVYEEINVMGLDGVKLNSWLIKSEQAKGTVIYLHGVADCKMDGIRFAKLLHDNNYNVFLFDARRHGDSDGEFCTFGYYEKYDLEKVIEYLLSRTDVHLGKIALFGTSMGAAVAIQTAAIDKRIAAVISENSFATLRTIFDDYQKRMVRLPFHYLRNIVIKRSELMAKFKANDVSPLESLKNITIPILFIYGTEDHLINHQYTIKLYNNANDPKKLFPIHGAKHNDTWQVAGKEYENRILHFLQMHLQ